MLIEPANASRIGRASTGSAPARNDESSSDTGRPPCNAPRIGALAGFAATAGSLSAARNAGWRPRRGSCRPPACRAAVNRMDRNTAVPSVPPIWRKNVVDAVATPMSRGGIAFCTARVSGCMLPPRPQPTTSMISCGLPVRRVDPDPGQAADPDDHQRQPDDRPDLVAPGARDHLPGEDRHRHDAEHQRQRLQAGLGGRGALDDLQVQRQQGERAEHAHAGDERRPPSPS